MQGKGFGIGAAAADFDGDGWTDLLVTNYGVNELYRNNHDGTFTDVTAAAKLTAPGLWTSAAWFDFDGDGRSDLFIGHFVAYNKNLERDCREKGIPHYCYPLTYEPRPSKLYAIIVTPLLPMSVNRPESADFRVKPLARSQPISIAMESWISSLRTRVSFR